MDGCDSEMGRSNPLSDENALKDEIRINIIGISERIQIQLAAQTGGKWYGINKN